MKSRMYWGVAILILLLVSAAVFVILHETAENRQLNEQLADAEKLADEINKRKIAENNPLPKEPISDPVEPQDDTEVPNKNSQQNGNVETVNESVEKVLAADFLKGLAYHNFNLYDSITLPTNAQLSSYTDEDIKQLYRVIHEVTKKASAIDDLCFERVEALHTIDYNDLSEEQRLQISDQSSKLKLIMDKWDEQDKRFLQETERIREYRRGF